MVIVRTCYSTGTKIRPRPHPSRKYSSHYCQYRCQATFNECVSPIIPECRSWWHDTACHGNIDSKQVSDGYFLLLDASSFAHFLYIPAESAGSTLFLYRLDFSRLFVHFRIRSTSSVLFAYLDRRLLVQQCSGLTESLLFPILSKVRV